MIIRQLSIHAAQRMQEAGKESHPVKVIRTLESLRNRGFRKPTKDIAGEYIVAEHGVWVVRDEKIVTYISSSRIYEGEGGSEAKRAYETFFKRSNKAAA